VTPVRPKAYKQDYTFCDIADGNVNQLHWPSSFAFLSGLPEQARKRRPLMPVRAFVDESIGGGHFVLAGLIAPAESWKEFSTEWDACLKRHPAIEYFKMREAAKLLQGQFRGWYASERDNKLRELLRIIDKYSKVLISYSVDLKAHAETFARVNEKPLNEPYFWSFQTMIMSVCLELWDRGLREKFEIIFDEQVIFGRRSKVWYPVVRDVCQRLFPEEYSLLPVDPLFRNDKEFLPLQASDLFAWLFLRVVNNQKHTFDWIRGEMRSLVYSEENSQHFDRERMEAIVERAKKNAKGVSLEDEIVRTHRKIFHRDY
jgi:Protein of unknown function (DUF3800)